MKAYVLKSESNGATLELREKPTPQPSASQLLVKIHAASMNRGELIRGHGLVKAGAEKPAGMDCAGEVVGTGEKVMGRLPGAFAEYGLMDKQDAIPMPPNLSWEEAAAIPITFNVVYDMLVQQGNLKAGEWLLVTGVTAGVGVAALQAGKALGAKVMGTSGSAAKLAALKKIGLDVALQTRKPDFADAVMKATDGKGVNLVVNNVGGTVFAECIKCMAYEGRLATVGYLDHTLKAEIDLAALQQVRAYRRHVVTHVPPLRVAVERPGQRPRVEIANGADPYAHGMAVKRPSRSTAENPAASMLRRTSSSGARRWPSGASSEAVTLSRSSAPNVSATCASFGP
ncbi:MAG TPA: zinc-binding dehydrogenase [Usitatibacter sp.]|nr:zinc-binding dehydrogenase [Usitatibacter sp.]